MTDSIRQTMYPDTAKLMADLNMLDRLLAHNRELIGDNNLKLEELRRLKQALQETTAAIKEQVEIILDHWDALKIDDLYLPYRVAIADALDKLTEMLSDV
ncbi:hypothetical protein KKH18_06875 [bacterium]|nr:hypothetical protein [bacterium]